MSKTFFLKKKVFDERKSYSNTDFKAAVTTIATFGLGWTLLPCLGMELATNFAVNLISNYKAEKSAIHFVQNAKGVQDL